MKLISLTGYWHASTMGEKPSDTHGHYIEGHTSEGFDGPAPVIHKHEDGDKPHFHETGDMPTPA
jgi:hypothetical protein